MEQLKSVAELQAWRKAQSGTLGFVPTMGALHDGHLSLMKRARASSQTVLASIFINPTQFDDPQDFSNYPSTLADDLSMLESAKVDAVFLPRPEQLYPDGYRYKVQETELSRKLCGAHRPGHFDGVLTVVMKLLNLAQASEAYFGEKDYQQFLLIRDMAQLFFMPTRIISCPTVREPDGLAMSSRNRRLSAAERKLAPEFFRSLGSGLSAPAIRAELTAKGFDVDYVEELYGRRFGAVRLGAVRLIDNVPLEGSAL